MYIPANVVEKKNYSYAQKNNVETTINYVWFQSYTLNMVVFISLYSRKQ